MTDPQSWSDTTVEWIPLGKIRRDQRVNTRPVDNGWVDRKLLEGFDPNKFGTPTVSQRNNYYVYLDGQNRGALAVAAGFKEAKVQCVVFHDLTRDQEASIFLGLNDSRTVKPIYKFLARVAAKDPVAVAVYKSVTEHGWRVKESGDEASLMAVAAVEWVYGLDPTVLDQTLDVLTAAWGYGSDTTRSTLIKGVGNVIYRYKDVTTLSLEVLTKHLNVYRGGANGVYTDAKGLQGYRGGAIHNAVSEVVVNAYNKGRRTTGRIAEWSN